MTTTVLVYWATLGRSENDYPIRTQKSHLQRLRVKKRVKPRVERSKR